MFRQRSSASFSCSSPREGPPQHSSQPFWGSRIQRSVNIWWSWSSVDSWSPSARNRTDNAEAAPRPAGAPRISRPRSFRIGTPISRFRFFRRSSPHSARRRCRECCRREETGSPSPTNRRCPKTLHSSTVWRRCRIGEPRKGIWPKYAASRTEAFSSSSTTVRSAPPPPCARVSVVKSSACFDRSWVRPKWNGKRTCSLEMRVAFTESTPRLWIRKMHPRRSNPIPTQKHDDAETAQPIQRRSSYRGLLGIEADPQSTTIGFRHPCKQLRHTGFTRPFSSPPRR